MRARVLCLLGFACIATAHAAPPTVVAAENMYADLARQIGGPGITATAIMSNPDEDPHLFEASPTVARALSTAGLVIYNGADYDPWMRPLLTATAGAPRAVLDVADLLHVPAGANPHLWYDPKTMHVLAAAIAHALEGADPAGATAYASRLATVQASLAALDSKVAGLRAKYRGRPITATEPVFGLMAANLGLVDRNQDFQRAVMNDTEPSASQVAGMEDDLRGSKVQLLIRNAQTDDAATTRLVRIARDAHVPVVNVTETEPANTSYQEWMVHELDALDQALAKAR